VRQVGSRNVASCAPRAARRRPLAHGMGRTQLDLVLYRWACL